MRYLGGTCPADPTFGNTQEAGKVTCDDFDPIPDPVFIVATDKNQEKLWFSGEVKVGGEFDIDATNGVDKKGKPKTKLDAETFVFIYDQEGGTLLQKIMFHTSCSQPLKVEDIFGTLELTVFVPEN